MAFTIEQYQRRLGALIQHVETRAVDAILVPAANRLLATIKNRVAQQGKNAAGGGIGQYSTKAAYFSRSQFDKRSAFKPAGKAGKGPKKNGQPRQSMYIAAGYKGLRDVQGKPTKNVNLNYRGDLIASYQLGRETKAVVLGLNRQSEAVKRIQLEKKYGRVLQPTKQELKTYNDEVLRLSARMVAQFLR